MLIAPHPPPFATPAPALDRESLSMGTRLRVHLEGSGDLGAASASAFAEADRIEAACSTWRPDSPWSRLNAAGQADLDPEWSRLLEAAKSWSLRMGGVFDPALGRLVAAWGARSGGRVPSEAELAEARRASGAAHLQIEGRHVTLTDGAGIEEGGFVKGYALDRMKAAALRVGARSGLLDFGGQLLVWGRARSVTLADPKDRATPRLALRLKDASLACSSDAVRGAHLLDPRTGRPCEAWGEVAVVAPSGFEADVLSKLFVLGPQRGLAWADAHGAAAAFLPKVGAPTFSRAFRALHPVSIQEPR